MNHNLTTGAIRAMIATHTNGGSGGNNDNFPPPILQIIDVKAVQSAHGDRVRAMLSDGQHYVTGMVGAQVLATIAGSIQSNCIVRVDRFICNYVSNRHVIIILAVTVLEPGTAMGRIGSPVDVEKELSGGGAAAGATTNVVAPPPQPLYNSTNHSMTVNGYATNKPPDRPVSAGGGAMNPYGRTSASPGSVMSSSHINNQAPIVRSSAVPTGATPISALNMYNNRWTIQARLTVKSDIKTWSNSKGEGSLFSIELLDSSGQDIRATFFKEAVDKFYHLLTVGSVYSLTGGRLKVANMQYNTCKSQYEITFDQNAEIHLVNDDGNIAKQSFSFVKLAALEGMAANKNVDVLAIVKSVGEAINITSKKTGQELMKCDAVLVDDSGVEVNLTFWGDRARTASQDCAGQPVVAVGRARVSDYGGGVSLSSGPTIAIRPDIPEAQALASWWSAELARGSANTTIRSLSGSGASGRADTWADRKSVSTIKQENLGNGGEKADYLSFKATISFIKKDKDGGAWYPACANAGDPCKNRYKVTPTTDGQWYCEKCEQTYPNPVRRFIFSGVVEDGTSSTWVSFFNEQAETLLGGVTADQVYEQSHPGGMWCQEAYDDYFAPALFSEWIFKCKVKSEFHNDETRIKTSVFTLHPVNYVQECRDLLAAIEQF